VFDVKHFIVLCFILLCDEMPLSDAFGWVAGRGLPHPASLKKLEF